MTAGAIQNLTYFAGMTNRIDFGTMVVVLPWYDPVVICEQISVLDNMLQGRKLTIGLGRGAGAREFDSFRTPMGESRGRFMESLQILRKAWRNEFFSHEGDYFTIPETTIRPRPRTPGLIDNLIVAWISPETLRIAAEADLGMLFTNQKSWKEYRADLHEFNGIRAEQGWSPRQPTVVVNMVCTATAEEGRERMLRHITEAQDSVERHYHFSDSAHFKKAGGYEFYELFEKTLKTKSLEEIGEFNTRPQAFGTPEECLSKLQYIQRMTSAGEIVAQPPLRRHAGRPGRGQPASLRRVRPAGAPGHGKPPSTTRPTRNRSKSAPRRPTACPAPDPCAPSISPPKRSGTPRATSRTSSAARVTAISPSPAGSRARSVPATATPGPPRSTSATRAAARCGPRTAPSPSSPAAFVVHPVGELHEYRNGPRRTLPFRVRHGGDPAPRIKEWPSNPNWTPTAEDLGYYPPD